MRTVNLLSGQRLPVLGQGTWRMGENASEQKAEADALRLGIDLGLTLIDTAEMYADAELVVADAIKGRRDGLFIVSKVLPSNASFKGTIKACERSLKRLGIDCLDLYLLHWESQYPLTQTLEAFERLRDDGKIKSYGVSNFDTRAMRSAVTQNNGVNIVANQVLYGLYSRGIEWSLLPWCREQGVVVMSYSPLAQGDMTELQSDSLEPLAKKHGVTPAQIALAWVLHQPGVVTIPKAVNSEHVRQNIASLDIALDEEDMAVIDQTFLAPDADTPLHII